MRRQSERFVYIQYLVSMFYRVCLLFIHSGIHLMSKESFRSHQVFFFFFFSRFLSKPITPIEK